MSEAGCWNLLDGDFYRAAVPISELPPEGVLVQVLWCADGKYFLDVMCLSYGQWIEANGDLYGDHPLSMWKNGEYLGWWPLPLDGREAASRIATDAANVFERRCRVVNVRAKLAA